MKLPSNAVETARALKSKEDTVELINKALLNADELELENWDYVLRDNTKRKAWAQSSRIKADDIAS